MREKERWVQECDKKRLQISQLRTRAVELQAEIKGLERLESEVQQDIVERQADVFRFRLGSFHSIDDLIEQKRHVNNDILTENKRLESRIRVARQQIQSVQRENQKLEAVLDVPERLANCR